MNKIHNMILGRYTQFPNGAIIDPRLSDGAVRLFLYLCSKYGLEWSFNNSDIKKQLEIKRDETIAKYFRELIESGWISRTPRMKNNRPSGFYNYILHFESINNRTTEKAELRNNATPQNADSDNQQPLKNRSYNNTELGNNTNTNNTPLPPKMDNEGGDIWLQVIKNLNLNFNDNELLAIVKWSKYLTAKLNKITIFEIESDLQNLAKHKSNNYNIVTLIEDTIHTKYRGLLNPTPKYLIGKPSGSRYSSTKERAFRFNNPEYFVPENDSEVNRIVTKVVDWYKAGVNPKTRKILSEPEVSHIKSHMANAAQAHVKWSVYVKDFELTKGISLLDIPVTEIVVNNKPLPADLQKILDRKNSKYDNNKDE